MFYSSSVFAIATPVLADYLGPNRTVTETISVCKVVLYECQYVPARDLWKYKPVDDWSCSNEGKPWQGYDNYNGECGLFSKGRTQWGKQEKLQTVTTTQPEATISSALQGCNLNNGWCNTASELSLTGTEPLSGYSILAVEGTLNGQSFACSGDNCAVPLNEGDNDFTFWALSSWGDSSQMGTFTAKVDTVSPALGLDIMATSGSNGWYVSPATITATGSDSTSGLSSVFLSVDNGAWQSSTTLNEGVYNVLVQAEDNAGNISSSSTIISVDTTTPTMDVSVNGTAGNNGWYSSSMEVSATTNDATSGVASLESSLDGGVYQVYISPVSFADDYHTVQFKAVDKAGNETETSVQEFYVDTIAPVVDLPAEWEVNDTITYKVQDDGSGLSALRIVIEDEDEKYAKVAWDEAVSGNKFKGEITWNGKFKDGTVAPPGEYLVWVKTTDVAGNERIALGRVIVPHPFASFNLIQPSKPSTGIPTPPADLFVPKDSSPTTENLLPTPSSSTNFGGSTSPTNSTSVQSLTLASGKSSASTTTSSNPSTGSGQGVLWGATAAALIGWATATALEEKKKRKEQEQAQAAQVQAQVEAFNDAQTAKRIAEMKQWKINSWLEGQAILNAQIEQLEQQGATPKEIDALKEKAKIEGLGVARNEAGVLGAQLTEQKMQVAAQADMTEQEKWLAYTSTPEYVARQERLAEWEKAEEKKKAQDLQDGLAAYYAATRQGEKEAQTNWWDRAVDFAQENIIQPVQDAITAIATAASSEVVPALHAPHLAKLKPAPALDGDPPNWFEQLVNKIRNILFASGDESPTPLDHVVATIDSLPVIKINGWSEWSDTRKQLLASISSEQDDYQYNYDKQYLELGTWNSQVSINQLKTLQAYVSNGEVAFEDILASIETLQVYKNYNNSEMITALREIYYADTLDPFIFGAQNVNSSAFNIFVSESNIPQGNAQFALAMMMLTTQGNDYAPPVIEIKHPQGYSATGEFGLDHIIAALDGQFHNSSDGYIFSDELDNENRPPWLGLIGTNPFSGELETVKNLIAKASFWWLKTDPKTIQSVPEVTWLGDLAGSTAKAYETGNAEDGYEIEMPLSDFESDILGVVLAHNNAIDPDGKNLANELSDALAADSPYVAQKYSYFADAIGLDVDSGVISPESAQRFVDDHHEMVSDLGTGFYALQNWDLFSLLPNNQTTMHDFSEEQIKHFLQQIQENILMEMAR